MSGLPPISTTAMPPDVRAGGAKAQAVYAAGLAFEQQLITQLASSLGQSSGDDDDDATSGIIQGMLPQALAQGVTDAGGVGLAAQLARSALQAQS